MSLRYAVLGIIQHKPQHGYEIKQAIEDSFGEIWNVSYGQLYPTLRSLTEKELVHKHKEQGQKSLEKNVYEITEKGRKVLSKWLSETPKKVTISGKDEFSLLYLFQMINGMEDQRQGVLDKQRGYFESMREKFRGLYDNAQEADRAKKVLIRRIILRIEAELNWLDELKSNTF